MMKYLLLVCLLFGALSPAAAQYEGLVVSGVVAGASLLKSRPQKPDEYVVQAYYHNRPFQQKRTLANKLPKKGSSQIANLEQFLDGRHAVLQASDTTALLGSDLEADYLAARTVLSSANPLWSLAAYDAELEFYRREDYRRTTARQLATSQRRQQRQARAYAMRDSIFRVELRRTQRADSLARVLAARRVASSDSLARVVTTSASTAAPTPVTPAIATTAVATAANRAVAIRRPAAKPTIKKTKVVVKRSTGPVVYYCASGNTVKYHASPNCRGLSRCGASIVPISQRQAEMQMDPCKFCY